MRCFNRYAGALLLAGALALVAWAGSASAANSTQNHLAGYSSPGSASPEQPSGSSPSSPSNPGSSSMNPPSSGSSESMMGSSSSAQLPQGVTPKQISDTSDFRRTLDKFSTNALKKDNFKDLCDYFVKSDEDRLTKAGNSSNEALDQAIDDFNQAWKSKYSSGFNPDRDKAYADQFLSVSQGEATNPEQIAHWPVKSTASGSEPMTTANPTIKKGAELAVVTLQGSGNNQQAITASLVREIRSWRFDIPDNVTADDLKASLTRHIREVTTMKNQWPSDPNEAARVVTHHLLQALYSAAQGPSSSESSPTR